MRVHTNHEKRTDDRSKLTKQDWHDARSLLHFIRIKIRYKQLDLWRDMNKIRDVESLCLEEVGENIQEEDALYRTFTPEWEFLMEDDLLIDALHQLTDRQQEILWMLIVEGKSQEEVADSLSQSPASVSQTKKRAYKQLRIFLERKRED